MTALALSPTDLLDMQDTPEITCRTCAHGAPINDAGSGFVCTRPDRPGAAPHRWPEVRVSDTCENWSGS